MCIKKVNKAVSIITIVTFLFTNTTHATSNSNSRSLFKDKRVDYKKLSTQSEERLRKKRAIFQGENDKRDEYKRQEKTVLTSHLKDISQIHIPSELGRVIEAYSSEDKGQRTENRLIVHIQDLHTNPEAQYNLANILALLIKDYNLGLVLSEGAEGEVDTSSVSSFPDYEVREKVAKIFVNSGELTGEEYLSITKYPDLQIWGIEDRNIYFKNIIEFNKIMKFSPSSQVFISQAKKALDSLKEKIYSKELQAIDKKEQDFEDSKIQTDEYLKTLSGYISKFNISTDGYKNIALLMDASEQEKGISQEKIIQQSQALLLTLQANLSKQGLKGEIDSLIANAQLFKDEKISPFSFYSYLKDLALKYLPDNVSKYPDLSDFVEYLTKVNSLDSTKLFNEMADLTYDVKQHLAQNEEQRILTQALRNIKFLEGFFNLKVSNEELDYYLHNKDSHKVGFFKSAITALLNKTNSTNQTSYIDFNPDLIDNHLQELEDFYNTVKARDTAMIENSLMEIERRSSKLSALISGGFHTKGITRLLKDKGYSYIVISPYSSTDIDEENYHFLLSGKRKPLSELIEELNTTLRLILAFVKDGSFADELTTILTEAGISEETLIKDTRVRFLSLLALGSSRALYLRAKRLQKSFQLTELPEMFSYNFYKVLGQEGLVIEAKESNTAIHIKCGEDFFGIEENTGRLIKSNETIFNSTSGRNIVRLMSQATIDLALGGVITGLEFIVGKDLYKEGKKVVVTISSEKITVKVKQGSGLRQKDLYGAKIHITEPQGEMEADVRLDEKGEAFFPSHRLERGKTMFLALKPTHEIIGVENVTYDFIKKDQAVGSLSDRSILASNKTLGKEEQSIEIIPRERHDVIEKTDRKGQKERIFLSKPTYVAGIGGTKIVKRYFGQSAVERLDDLLGQFGFSGKLSLRKEDKGVKYALLHPVSDNGLGKSNYYLAISEEHPDGDRILWTKPLKDIDEGARLASLLEILCPAVSRQKEEELFSWRDVGYGTTKSTVSYPKSAWGEKQARLIEPTQCDNCMECVVNCPEGAMFVSGGDFLEVSPDHCAGCYICEEVCPTHAIKLEDKAPIVGTRISSFEEGAFTELEGALAEELRKYILKHIDGKEEIKIGDFAARKVFYNKKSLGGKEILQIELRHSLSKVDEIPLILTLVNEKDKGKESGIIRPRTNILVYGTGKIEKEMAARFQERGYVITAAIERTTTGKEILKLMARFTEIDSTYRGEFKDQGIFSELSLVKLLNKGDIDLVVSGELSAIDAPNKRHIIEKTRKSLPPLSLTSIGLSQDRTLNAILTDIREGLSPEELYPHVGRTAEITNMFKYIMQYGGGIRSGHRLCPGCPQPIIAQITLQVAEAVAAEDGKKVKRIVCPNTGCMTASGMSNLDGSLFDDPAIRATFGNAVSVASGVEVALKKLEEMERLNPDERYEIIVFSGDGGTADIHLELLSGAAERGHKIVYVCFDNEGYMNTGGQSSSSTYISASTKTTPAGAVIPGKLRSRKNVADYLATHSDVLSIETSPEHEQHFIDSLRMAFQHKGFAFLNVNSYCHTGQGFSSKDGMKVSDMRVKAGMFPLTTRIHGKTNVVVPTERQKPQESGSLLNWMSQRKEFSFLFEGDKESLAKGLRLKDEYKALYYLTYLYPVIEALSMEGRFKHLLKRKAIVTKKSYGEEYETFEIEPRQEYEAVVNFLQLDIAIRWLNLLRQDVTKHDIKVKTKTLNIAAGDFQKAIDALEELRTTFKEESGRRIKLVESSVREDREKAVGEEVAITMDEEMRRHNNQLLGDTELRIKFNGFAGQGAQVSSNILARLSFLLGFYTFAEAEFGPERRGKPVYNYNKINSRPITDRSKFIEHEISIVMREDQLSLPHLRKSVFKGLKKDGILIINTSKSPEEIRNLYNLEGYKIYTADLERAAIEFLKNKDNISVATLGVIMRVLQDLGIKFEMESLKLVIGQEMRKLTQANLAAFDKVFKEMVLVEQSPPVSPNLITKSTKVSEPPSLYEHKIMTGNEAVATAITNFPHSIFIAYPITPATTVSHKLAEMKANGDWEGDILIPSSEYDAMGAQLGASLISLQHEDFVIFTATGSQGLLLIYEILPLMAGLGAPGVMFVAARGMSRRHLTIFADNSTDMSTRDMGWITFHCSNAQEVYDMMNMAPVISKKLRKPMMVVADGFEITHTSELVKISAKEKIDTFRKSVKIPKWKSWEEEGTYVPGSAPISYMEGDVQEAQQMLLSIGPINDIFERYKSATGAKYGFIDEYGPEDADVAIVVVGTTANTAKVAVDKAKDLGINVKVINIKSFIPFPAKEIAKAIQNTSSVVVLDRSMTPGQKPPIFSQVSAAEHDYNRIIRARENRQVKLLSEIYGLGGRRLSPQDILEIIRKGFLATASDYVDKKDLAFMKDILMESRRELDTLKASLGKEVSFSDKALEIKHPEYQESSKDVADLVKEIAYIRTSDMRLMNPGFFETDVDFRKEVARYFEELIDYLSQGDYVRFLGIHSFYGVREGVQDERNKRNSVIELIETARSIRKLKSIRSAAKVNHAVILKTCQTVLLFSQNEHMRKIALDKLEETSKLSSNNEINILYDHFSNRERKNKLALTGIFPRGEIKLVRLQDMVPNPAELSDITVGIETEIEEYLRKREVIFVAQALGLVPGTPEYNLLKDSTISFTRGDLDPHSLFGAFEKVDLGKERTEGFAATVSVEGEVGASESYLRDLIEAEDYETIAEILYHEKLERALTKTLGYFREKSSEYRELLSGDKFSDESLHEVANRLSGKNFGFSRIDKKVTRAGHKSTISEAKHYGIPRNSEIQKYYIQSLAIERAEESAFRFDNFFREIEALYSDASRNPKAVSVPTRNSIKDFLDELVENGYSGIIREGNTFKSKGIKILPSRESKVASIEGYSEVYLIIEEKILEPATGLKKLYLGNEVVPILKQIMKDVKDEKALRQIERGGKAAILSREGYPLALGLIWETEDGDVILWTNEPPTNTKVEEDWYGQFLSLFSLASVTSPVRKFTEWGYEQYPEAGIYDNVRQSSLQTKTSTWTEEIAAINFAKCVNCLHCVFKCPDSALIVSEGANFIGVDPDHCKGCGICVGVCQEQDHDAISMVKKAELEGTFVSNLDKVTGWSSDLKGDFATALYNFINSKSRDEFIVGDHSVKVVLRGKTPERKNPQDIFQIEVKSVTAPRKAVPVIFTFIKDPKAKEWSLVVRPKNTVLVYGTGELEAELAKDLLLKGFNVIALKRGYTAYLSDIRLDEGFYESRLKEFQDAGLVADDLYWGLIVKESERLETSTEDKIRLENIQGEKDNIKKKLSAKGKDHIIDYVVTYEASLVDPLLNRAIFSLTGKSVISPTSLLLSGNRDLDNVVKDVFENAPKATVDEYARRAKVIIPSSRLAVLSDKIFQFTGGHSLCAGCDAGIVAKNVIGSAIDVAKEFGTKVTIVFVGATGCLEVSTSAQQTSYFPGTGPAITYKGSYIHSLFENLGAVTSGIRRAWEIKKRKGLVDKDEVLVIIGTGGDGGIGDIGFGAVSGLFERDEKVLVICYDNGAYENTGIQASGLTPYYSVTTTSQVGKKKWPKNIFDALAVHKFSSDAYLATATTFYLDDFLRKLRKAVRHSLTKGPAYIGICASCVPGHRIASEDAVESNRLVVEAGMFPLLECEDGLTKLSPNNKKAPTIGKGGEINVQPGVTRTPIDTFLKWGGRFVLASKTPQVIADMQYRIDENLARYEAMSRRTELADKIIRSILNKWKQDERYAEFFEEEEDPERLEKDRFYGDIKREKRDIIGKFRRAVFSSKMLDGRLNIIHSGDVAKEVALEFEGILLGVVAAEKETARLRQVKEEAVHVSKIDRDKKEDEAPGKKLVTEDQAIHNREIVSSMIEGEWKSRGGIGAVSANKVLIHFLHALEVHEEGFPEFGPERKGKEVKAYFRISGEPIMSVGAAEQVTISSILELPAWEQEVVLDKEFGEKGPSFLSGVRQDGVLLFNTPLSPQEIRERYGIRLRKIYTVDASGIAEEILGDRNRANMVMLGAAVRALEYFDIQYDRNVMIEIIKEGIGDVLGLSGKALENNIKGFLIAYGSIMEEENSPSKYVSKLELQHKLLTSVSPKGIVLDGNQTAVLFITEAGRYFKDVVFAGFPITPTTQVMEGASFLGDTTRDIEFIQVESEHSAFSTCYGVAVAGGIAVTATGSQGGVLAYEPRIAGRLGGSFGGAFLAFQGNREINAPNINIHRGHSDAMTTMHSGWLQFHAASQQDVYDLAWIGIISSILSGFSAEVNMDGFFLTHSMGLVRPLSEEELEVFIEEVYKSWLNVDEKELQQVKQTTTSKQNYIENLLKRIRSSRKSVLDGGMTLGGMDLQDIFTEHMYQQNRAQIISNKAIALTMDALFKATKREFSFFKTYKTKDAEIVFSVMGSTARPVMKAIDDIREETGLRVGLLQPVCFRPWNTRDVVSALGSEGISVVVALDIFDDLGATYSPVAADITTSLATDRISKPVLNRIGGLGGRDIKITELKELMRKSIVLKARAIATEKDKAYIADLIENDPEIKALINRLSSLHLDEKDYRANLINNLKLRDYYHVLGLKDYFQVRSEQKEIETKEKLVRLIELAVARDDLISSIELDGDRLIYDIEVLLNLSREKRDLKLAMDNLDKLVREGSEKANGIKSSISTERLASNMLVGGKLDLEEFKRVLEQIGGSRTVRRGL